MRRNRISAAAAIAAVAVLALGTSAGAGIIVDGVTTGTVAGGAGNKTLQSTFDASGSDKLVVVIGGEHGFPNNVGGNFNSMTYGGTALTEAVQEGSTAPTLAIFYLDSPGAAGDLVVNQENHNSSLYAIYLLSGTSEGVGATNKDTADSVDLATTGTDSLVIAGILDAGPNDGNNAPNLTAVSPLTEDTPDLVYNGRRWTSLSAGHAIVASPGAGTYSFSGAGTTDTLAIGAVEFQAQAAAVPEPSTFVLTASGLLALAWFARRRRRR